MPATTEPRFLTIPFVRDAPWIDGRLHDDAWKRAARWSGFLDITPHLDHRYNVSSGNPDAFKPAPVLRSATPRSRVLACHDRRFLYVAFICDEPAPSELRRRDRPLSTNVDREDCVIVWLDPALSHFRPYTWEYIVNVRGQKSEFLRGRYAGDYLSLMEWEGRVEVGARRWTAELMLPLERLGLNLTDGTAMGLNFARGYRGDWQRHALIAPDEDYLPGWGFGVLAGESGRLRARGVRQVRDALRAYRRAQEGKALPLSPGSVREQGPHRDANAMVGISVWGPDHQPTVSVGRSDSYDRRWYGNALPTVTRTEVIAAARSGDPARLDALRHRADNGQYGAYQHFPAPKPVGQIIFRLPGGPAAGWKTVVSRGEDGAIRLRAQRPSARCDLTLYVHKRLNLIVAEGVQSGLDGQALDVRLYRHNDNPRVARIPGYNYEADEKAGLNTGPLAPPVPGARNGMGWLRQRFAPDLTFPAGFEVVLAGALRASARPSIRMERDARGLGTPARSRYEGWVDPMSTQTWAATDYERLNATPGSAVTFRLPLRGERFRGLFPAVSTNDGPDAVRAAQRVLRATAAMTPAELERDSRRATPEERIGNYCYKQDLALSSVFSAKFCWSDTTAWHADNHFNEFYFDFITKPVEELETFFQMVEAHLPAARALAHEAFECRGAAFGVAAFPMKLKRLPMTSLDWDYSIECTGLVFQPFWQAYLYTQDRAFLERRGYPALREAALFYADYATRERDGRYHLWPCTSSEHVMLQPHLKYNRDSQAALTMARYILNAAASAAAILGRDARDARRWRGVADRLAPYPIEQTPAGPRFVDVAGARLMTEYNIFQPLSCVFFGDDVGLASPAEAIAIARRTLRGLQRLSTTHWPHVYRAMTRLGMYHGGPISAENLLQSHQGPIFIFPAVPKSYTGAFRDYRARGAFRVTAAMRGGRVGALSIRSEAGGPCVVSALNLARCRGFRCVEDACTVRVRRDGRTLAFPTEAGRTYEAVFAP